jgi:hypothetical protein
MSDRPPLLDRVAALLASGRLDAADLERMERFLLSDATGQIVWHVSVGRVMGTDCNDMQRRRAKDRGRIAADK